MADDKTLEIVERLARIETMLNTNIELLNSKATIQDVNALKERLDKVESNQTWLTRGFGATIIVAIMNSIGQFL